MAKNFDFFKTLLNGLLTKMQSYAKKSEVYTKKETYTRSETDKQVANVKNILAPVATTGDYYDLENTPNIPYDIVRYDTNQTFSEAAKQRVRKNIGAAATTDIPTDTVKYSAQTLTSEQQAQVRTNIGAGTSSFSGSYEDLTEKPENYFLDVEYTEVFSWDNNTTGRDSFTYSSGASGTIAYYKVSDMTFTASDVISSRTIEETASQTVSRTATGMYIKDGIAVFDSAGYYYIGNYSVVVPSPGVYFYTYKRSDSSSVNGTITASITYRAKGISDDVVGVARTVNGVQPDNNGNIAIDIPAAPVQSDLSQNDSTQLDYVKNRTHYVDQVVMASPPVVASYGASSKTSMSSIPIKMSETISVYKNGSRFCIIGIDAPCTDSFAFASNGLTITYSVAEDTTPGLYTISVTFTNEYVSDWSEPVTSGYFTYTYDVCHPLDDKFIPSTIQRVGDDVILNSSTEGSTKKFKLMIDDSGTITATEVT